MMKILYGFALGVVATILTTLMPSVAPIYSQAIYDCGVRVAGGVTGLSITDGEIIGHRFGVCIDPGAKGIWLSGNFIVPEVAP